MVAAVWRFDVSVRLFLCPRASKTDTERAMPSISIELTWTEEDMRNEAE